MALGPTIVGVLARAHRAWFIVPLVAALLASGCGSTRILTGTSTHAARATPLSIPGLGGGPVVIPDPGPTRVHPAAADVRVIRGWSDALRRGDLGAAASYFSLPSVMIDGTDANGNALVIQINSRAQAEAANAALPCGARLISADQRGRYVNALFRLTGRRGLGGSDCGTGAGETARTNFVIAHGLIVEWIRAPDDPGDNGEPTTPTPAPAPVAPEVLQPSGPSV
jgi:hypothetical protein